MDLLEAANLVRQLIRDRDYEGINKIINYTIESDYFECFSWIMLTIQITITHTPSRT